MNSTHKLGIIVPYRNRQKHLSKFKNSISEYLKKKDINFELIVVEQDNEMAFNRGILLNIGFLHAKKLGCDYVVFHDVDMLPIDVDYSYSDIPLHLATDFISQENMEKITFDQYFGGVTMFPTKIFYNIDGYSNDYWGWGYEDDDLLYRCKKNHIQLDHKEIMMQGGNSAAIKFNGRDSYVSMRNVFNSKEKSTIFVSFYPYDMVYDQYKTEDYYTIFSVPSNEYDSNIGDFFGYYNSYLRYGINIFDENKECTYVQSNISTNYKTNLCLTINPETKEIKIYQDGNLIDSKRFNNLFEYENQLEMFLGVSNPNKKYDEKYFTGEISSFAIFSKILGNNEIREMSKNQFFGLSNNFGNYKSSEYLKLYYDGRFLKNNKLMDLSGNNNDGTLHNCEIVGYVHESSKYIDIPFRRKSTFELLKHNENGYVGMGWKEKLTRYNQLKFFNDLKKKDNLSGLSTLSYERRFIEVNENYHHIHANLVKQNEEEHRNFPKVTMSFDNIEVDLNIDQNGIISVTAKDTDAKKWVKFPDRKI